MAQVIYRRPPKLSKFLIFEKMPKSYVIDNRRKEMSTKLWYSTISQMATLGLSAFFWRCARLRSRAHDFHCSIEKRCGKLGG